MHISVLLEESLEYLNIKENDIIVDCTLGYAGHSSRILKQLKKGQLYSFDQDKDAINYSDKLLKEIISFNSFLESYNIALKYLNSKLRTEKEIRKKLANYSSDAVNYTVNRLKEENYLKNALITLL